ncbi:MAG: hypothetical protein ABW185_02450 [Sedimenticola sp.]
MSKIFDADIVSLENTVISHDLSRGSLTSPTYKLSIVALPFQRLIWELKKYPKLLPSARGLCIIRHLIRRVAQLVRALP